MIRKHEKETLLELIDTFYKVAGESGWTGEINNDTAQIFTQMLIQAQRCLGDYTWGLDLSTNPITVQWLIQQLETRTIERMGKLNEEKTCLEFVIEQWDEELRLASSGESDVDEMDEFHF